MRKMAILWDGQVKMAHLAICAGYSVNGVARLHTDILMNQELRDFYEMFPEKFNNKTNGITQRRFLGHGNPLLADWVTEKTGSDAWMTNLAELEKLTKVATDKKEQKKFGLDAPYLTLTVHYTEMESADTDSEDTGADDTEEVAEAKIIDRSYTLYVGDTDKESGEYYVNIEGTKGIYTMNVSKIESLLAAIE